MRIIHGNNYTAQEKIKYKPLIIHNILDSIIRLINAMRHVFLMEFEMEDNEYFSNQIFEAQKNLEYENMDLTNWNKHLSENLISIQSIWSDKNIKSVYEQRNKFYLNDSTEL